MGDEGVSICANVHCYWFANNIHWQTFMCALATFQPHKSILHSTLRLRLASEKQFQFPINLTPCGICSMCGFIFSYHYCCFRYLRAFFWFHTIVLIAESSLTELNSVDDDDDDDDDGGGGSVWMIIYICTNSLHCENGLVLPLWNGFYKPKLQINCLLCSLMFHRLHRCIHLCRYSISILLSLLCVGYGIMEDVFK